MKCITLAKRLMPPGCGVCQVFTGIALLFALSLAIAITAPAAGSADPEVARQALCERDAGIVGETLLQSGLDVRTATWAQDRERAIQACKSDFANLRWLLNGK